MSYENEALTGMISDDFGEYLAHHGVQGMHPDTHIYGKWQNHAKYARGNPKYKEQAKAEKKASKAQSKAIMKDLRSTNKLSGVKGLASDTVSKPFKRGSDAWNEKRALKSEYKGSKNLAKADRIRLKREGADRAQLKDFDANVKSDLKSQKQAIRSARRNAIGSFDQGITNALNTLSFPLTNYVRAHMGENAAFLDLGLGKGWGGARRTLNKFAYYTNNPEKCNKKLESVVQSVRGSKPYRALLMDYARAERRAYYQEAYDRVIDSAFKNYGMTPTRTVNRPISV